MHNMEKQEELNPITRRLLTFIETKGSLTTMATKLGFAGNLFTNMRKRNTKPSFDVIEALAGRFEDFDLNYVVKGVRSDDTLNPSTDEALLRQLKRYENIIDSLTEMRGKTKGTLNSPYVDRESASDLLSSVIENNAVVRLVKYGIFGWAPGLN